MPHVRRFQTPNSFSEYCLNIASRSACGRAALMRISSPRQSLFVYFFQESLWQGDSGEWIFIEMIPQRGIGWEADTSASDSLFGDPLDEAPVGRQEHHSRETVKTQARSRPRHPRGMWLGPPNNHPSNHPPTAQSPGPTPRVAHRATSTCTLSGHLDCTVPPAC
jgi:hypothetical protein